MKITLGLNETFNCPEGNYRVVLERVTEPKKPINKPCQEQIRLYFRTKTGKEYLVARTFCADLAYGSELYEFLRSWLSGNFDPYLDDQGQVDFDLLIGKEADVIVNHWKGDDGRHKKPFSGIAAIFPPGTLVNG